MADRETAWDVLRSGKALSPQQSETFLDILFEERLLKPESISLQDKTAFINLAGAIEQSHHDSWLKDFLDAPFSTKANHYLESAIANRSNDASRELDDARTAEHLYLHAGNIAGAARSQTELIYAYRRFSRSSECLEEIGRLKKLIAQRSYAYFESVGDFESSNCQTMRSNFDLGRRFAEQANADAAQADYPALKLRALSLFSTSDSLEGRFQAAFNTDAAGLEIYWQGFYDGRRAFQFYSDAAMMAGQAGLLHLAAILQQEAIVSLDGTNAFDFQAMAHYSRATSLQRLGKVAEARQELHEAYDLFGRMRNPSFLLANAETELARIEIEQGDLSSARSHLKKASTALENVENFLVTLSYYNTLAELEHHRNRPDEEWKQLRKTIEIARHGFLELNSIDNRWEWYREVDRSFHRLIQLELDVSHDPVQALADWEAYRAAEIAPSQLTPESSSNRARLAAILKRLRSSTLISFVILPEKVVILIADDRGVRDFSVIVDSTTLQNEAERFLRLCSNPVSSLAKVNEAGSRLYKRLLQPIQKELTPDRSLIIEADGFLSRVPWAALVADDGKYLDEEYMTLSTPGLFFTGRSRQKTVAGRLVAYPGAAEFEGKAYPSLPHAREEADYVAHLQPGSVYLRENEVTSDELSRRLPHASSFHFAGHAVSREHGGELLLSNKEMLSASAVRHLDLSGMDLVVLSACSTADADLDIARSPNGLVQAFLSAGAREVVASRWDVDSRAALAFSNSFYEELSQSRDAATSVAAASQAVRSNPNAHHPYYWAAFELYRAPN